MGRIGKDHRRFIEALDRTTAWAGDPAAFGARAEAVSDWSVGQHLEHLLKADRGIAAGLSAAALGRDPPEGAEVGGHPSLSGWMVLLTGFIPRGRGKAPAFTVPEGAERGEVEAGLRDVGDSVRELGASLDAIRGTRWRLRHPVLGAFTPAQWLRFAGVHHAHHEKVIREILGVA